MIQFVPGVNQNPTIITSNAAVSTGKAEFPDVTDVHYLKFLAPNWINFINNLNIMVIPMYEHVVTVYIYHFVAIEISVIASNAFIMSQA